MAKYTVVQLPYRIIDDESMTVRIQKNFDEIEAQLNQLQMYENSTGIDINDIVNSSNVAWTDTAVNFSTRNDRINIPPTAPSILADGSAIDHVLNADGSADISFEWQYSGESFDADGFMVYLYSNSSGGAYTFGSNQQAEQVFYVAPDKRVYILHGVPSNKFYYFGVASYRNVDQDVDFGGILKSQVITPTNVQEFPYQPSTTLAFVGDISGTIDGQSVGSISKTPATYVIADGATSKNVNRADFVVPSGSSADTVIANAITALGSTGGKIVLMEGTYKINNYIQLTSNLTVEGQGDGTVLTNSPTMVNGFFYSMGKSNAIIKNLRINGISAIDIIMGIGFSSNSINCSVQNVTLENITPAHGVFISGGSSGCSIQNCRFNNCNVGIWLQEATTNYNLASNNVFTACKTAIYINSSYTVATSNAISGGAYIGIEIHDVNGCTISGNSIASCGLQGILLSQGSAKPSYNVVTSNTIKLNGGAGMMIYGENNTITGNNLYANNQESDGQTASIIVYGNYNSIQNNTSRNGGTYSPFYQVYISGTGNMLTNNDLYKEGGAYAIGDVGTGTVTVAGNRT